MKLIKFLNSLKLPFLIGTTSLLSGCSLTVPLLVFSGNGEDVYRGSATGYLDGSGTIKFSGTKFDVEADFEIRLPPAPPPPSKNREN